MNRDDRENLKFIIVQSQSGALDEWLDTLEMDELQYALALLNQYLLLTTKVIQMGKVSFIHRRPVINGIVQNSGGYTVAYRETDKGVEYAVAYCNPKDNFSKLTGRVKAEGRMKSANHLRRSVLNFDNFRNHVYQFGVDLVD